MQQPDYFIAPATDSILKVAIATASTAAAALPGKPGELLLVTCNTDTYAHFGASGVAEASATVYSVFIPAGAVFVMRNTRTHVRAIRATADGILSFSKMGDF